jgi:hypothetical protein
MAFLIPLEAVDHSSGVKPCVGLVGGSLGGTIDYVGAHTPAVRLLLLDFSPLH